MPASIHQVYIYIYIYIYIINIKHILYKGHLEFSRFSEAKLVN